MNFLIIYDAENVAQKNTLADFLAEKEIGKGVFLRHIFRVINY